MRGVFAIMTKHLFFVITLIATHMVYAAPPSPTDPQSTDITLGPSACGDTTTTKEYTWNPTPVFDASKTYFVAGIPQTAKITACPADLDSSDTRKIETINPDDDQPYKSVYTVDSLVKGNACKGDGISATYLLCLYRLDSGSTKGTLQASAAYVVNTLKLAKPTIGSIDVGDTQITLNVTPPSNNAVVTYDVCYGDGSTPAAVAALTAATGDCAAKSQSSPGPTITVSGLNNGTQYAFKVRTKNDAGTQSVWSDAETGTPVSASTPMSAYNGPANPTAFNCNAAPFSPANWALFVLLLGFLLGLRRGHQQ